MEDVLSQQAIVNPLVREISLLTSFKYFAVHKIAPTVGELRALMPANSANRLDSVLKSLGVVPGSVSQSFDSILSDPPTRTKPIFLFPREDLGEGPGDLSEFTRVLLVNPPGLVSDLAATVDALLASLFNQGWARARARAVDEKAVELLSGLLPGCRAFTGVEVDLSGDGSDRFEMDGVILFEDAAIFVEGKGAPLKLPSRRGDVTRFRGELDKLIGHGARQLRRDVDLLQHRNVALLDSNGQGIADLDGRGIRRAFKVLPCFDDFADIGTNVELLRRWGIIDDGPIPWIVSVTDLNLVTDTMRGPAELFGYMAWRPNRLADPRVMQFDEIELLAQFQYASDIQMKLDNAPENALAIFASKQPDFDAYYAGLDGNGPKRAVPQMKHTPRVRHFLDEMERRRPAGWLGATTAVLCAPGTVPAAVDAAERHLAQQARAEGVLVSSMSDMRLVVCGDTTPWGDVIQEFAFEPRTYPTWLLRADIRRRNKVNLEWACMGPVEAP